jgi:ABC-type nitrate/sulfonate/bicarbonate transport systems, periplasmic components
MALFRRVAAALAALTASASLAAQAEPLKIGYWTSGYSLGFGAVLEEGRFLEKEGLEVQYVKFSDVNAPGRALLTGDVDIAFAAPAAVAFNLGRQGAPVSVVLATQVLEGKVVVRADSPIKDVSALAGRKVGMSRPGSSTHAISVALFDGLYGIKSGGFTPVSGNEAQLTQLLLQGEVDAAVLRNVSVAQIEAGKVRIIADVVTDWKRLTKSDTAPVLAVALTGKKVAEERADDVAAFIRATRKAIDYGAGNVDKVAETLVKSANLNAENALSYAKLWETIYVASLAESDIQVLKRQNQVFVDAAAAEGLAPDSLYDGRPFQQATR